MGLKDLIGPRTQVFCVQFESTPKFQIQQISTSLFSNTLICLSIGGLYVPHALKSISHCLSFFENNSQPLRNKPAHILT